MKLTDYRLDDEAGILTPALLVYPGFVDANIEATLRIMGGDANRWRPHLKTAKMPWVIRRLIAYGVQHFKCATTRELLVACQSGARDVLIAYAMVGANARRAIEIAAQYPDAAVSILVENEAQARQWAGGPLGVFIDINPGMDRTGIAAADEDSIVRIARLLGERFRGLHYYDGHVAAPDPAERERMAHAGYDRLLRIAAAVESAGLATGEIITSGTPAFPAAMNYPGFRNRTFVHRASPGTVVFNDATSLELFPASLGYQAAALILATVVSHPAPGRITCDAGHKSVSADAGVPTCAVVGYPELRPLKPSEEHLPIDVPAGSAMPAIGDVLYLLPRHICPSVNQFDEALMVRHGQVEASEPVAARGHEAARFEPSPALTAV